MFMDLCSWIFCISSVELLEGKSVASSSWFLLLLRNGCDGQQIHPAALQRAVEQLTPKDEIAARPRKPKVVDGPLALGHQSMDWFKGTFTGKNRILNGKIYIWFPVGFPYLNESIESTENLSGPLGIY